MSLRVLAGGALVIVLADVAGAQLLGGQEFLVNAYTTGSQGFPAIATDAAGSFVAAWQSHGQDGDGLGIVARRFDANAVPQSPEVQVNQHTTNRQTGPSVASDAAGRFVVVWFDEDDVFYASNVAGRRYDAAAVPQGSEFVVHAYSTDFQALGAVASDSAGNFIVTWRSHTPADSTGGVFARRYDAAGAPLTGDFQVNTYTTNLQSRPAVTSDSAGNFVVVWESGGQDGSSDGIFAQRFDAAGTPQGAEFRVNGSTTGTQHYPRVATDGSHFVVVWESDDGSDFGVFGRRYDAAGVPQGGEFQVNAWTTFQQRHPDVAFAAGGTFMVVWESDGQDLRDRGVFARRYDAAGAPVGGEFQVNLSSANDEFAPAVAGTPAGGFIVLWTDGPEADVLGRRYGSEGPIGARRLTMRDGTRRRIAFQSKDRTLSTAPGVALDPVAAGAFLHVYNNAGGGDSACLPLPASGWVARGSAASPTYVYRDLAFVNGPCSRATLKHGRLLKVLCRGPVQPLGYTLDEPAQTSVAVDFRSAGARYCSVFGGTILADSGTEQRFDAVNAPPPGVCAIPPAPCP